MDFSHYLHIQGNNPANEFGIFEPVTINLEACFASVDSSVFLMTDRDLFHSTLPEVHHYNTTSKVLYHRFPHKCQVFLQTVPK